MNRLWADKRSKGCYFAINSSLVQIKSSDIEQALWVALWLLVCRRLLSAQTTSKALHHSRHRQAQGLDFHNLRHQPGRLNGRGNGSRVRTTGEFCVTKHDHCLRFGRVSL